MSQLQLRAEAAQAALDRFLDRPFKWGKIDCARIVDHCAKRLRVDLNMKQFGRYLSEKAARRALAAAGYADLGAWLDAQGLPRIAPAQAVVGDIIGLPHPEWGYSLTLVLGNGRVLACDPETQTIRVFQPNLAHQLTRETVAWRTLCLS